MKWEANDMRLNSPKSLRACAHEGVDPIEVCFVPFKEFLIKYHDKQISMLRFKFAETWRWGKSILYWRNYRTC